MIPDYEVLKTTCNLWRNWVDIEDSWESVLFISDYFAEHGDRVAPHAGPGHWNDPGLNYLTISRNIFFIIPSRHASSRQLWPEL